MFTESGMSTVTSKKLLGASNAAAPASRPLRVWPAVVMVALFWAFWVAHYVIPMDAGTRFISRMAMNALLLLGFLIWWLSRSAISWRDRLIAIALWIAGTWAAVKLADKSLADPFAMVLSTSSLVVTTWTAWVWLGRSLSLGAQ